MSGSAVVGLPRFHFPFHSFQTNYPENSTVVRLGKGYTFASQPAARPQRSFLLKFETMKWFTDSIGRRDPFTQPEINAGALEDFYKQVELHRPFWWQHPVEGSIVVRFSKPLSLPAQHKMGFGSIQSFEVELIEAGIITEAVQDQLYVTMDTLEVKIDTTVVTMDRIPLL